MPFVLFLFLTIITSNHICKSDDENNFVYRNLYGNKDYNYSFVKTLTELSTGIVQFIHDGNDLLAKEMTDTTPKFNKEYDFIVVGAGSAGCAVAVRLSETDNVTVLLIEAGGEENLLFDIPAITPFLSLSSAIDWKYRTEPSKRYCLGLNDQRCKWPQGKIMGGNSGLNFLLARGHSLDYDGWASVGNVGWSYNDTLKYFKKIENIVIPELKEDKKFHNTDGPLHISYPQFHTPLAEAFLKAGMEQGYPIIDYNGEKRIGFSYIQYNAKNGEKISTNRAYLYPNRKRKNLFVSKNSHVNKILIDAQSKKAYGLEFTKSGKSHQVTARKEIILCAGAIGSPKILMLSGVGPSDHLKDMKIEVIKDAPVGQNLADQLVYLGLVFLVDQPVSITMKEIINPFRPYMVDYLKKRSGPSDVSGGVEAIAFVDTDKPNDLDAYPNIQFLFLGTSLPSFPATSYVYGVSDVFWNNAFSNISEKHAWSIFPVLLHPRSRGELLLKNKNPKSKPKLIANYYDDPEDLRGMIKGIRAVIEISKTKAMQRFNSKLYVPRILGCENYKYDSDEYWECAVRTFSSTVFHQTGTCKMAPENDTSGVVNPRLQVIGVKGLRVADASIIPTSITGQPNLPTIMIGEKVVDMIKEDWGYKS